MMEKPDVPFRFKGVGLAADSSRHLYRSFHLLSLGRCLASCVIAVSLVMLSGCTGRAADAPRSMNHPPVIRSVTLGPTPLGAYAEVSAQVDVSDEDGDPVTLKYHWTVNGSPAGEEARPVLPIASLKRGDQVGLEVIPSDGTVQGASMLAGPFPVENTPPTVLRVTIELQESPVPPVLKAVVEGKDSDQAPITYFYRWKKNDRVIQEGEGPSLDAAQLEPRDLVIVEVTPRDPHAEGKMVRSEAYVVGNRSPRITSVPPGSPMGEHYEYLVQAVDKDGDLLTYDLERAPLGMTIQRETGKISWRWGSAGSGSHHVRVVASDGHGGTAFQEFDVVLTGTEAAAPSGA